MSVFPFSIDSDQDIIRIDDNISELGGQAINQLRDAVFAIETELGISPAGSAGTVANRFDVSHNADGSIKASALTLIGLATLPIVDNQVASNASIKEYKLALDFSTSDLHTVITDNKATLDALSAFSYTLGSDFNSHIAGAQLLSDSTKARHVASHVDLNEIPTDERDTEFSWGGLLDKNGAVRAVITVADALIAINDDLVAHENATSAAHPASAITVDTSTFIELPAEATDVQAAINAIDAIETSNIGLHRATQHAAGVPKIARSFTFDNSDRGQNIVPSTSVITYLVHAPYSEPTDNLSVGDDLIKFVPADPATTKYVFDSQFSQVKIGDTIRVNYGNGTETIYTIDSIRYTPGTEWIVRVNGVNLYDVASGATARIDRPRYDVNTYGVLAVAAANPTPAPDFSGIFMSSVIVGHPRGATALGLGFDPNQLDTTHYNLYLELYPTGNPADHVISLPAIDVTGDAGVSQGKYTLESVVQTTNDKFREIGFNYRFIAFAHEGEFGIMLADAIGQASFAIINGSIASGTIEVGVYTENVIDGTDTDDFDPLGLGTLGANLAGPAYISEFTDETAAQTPTKVIVPLKNRSYIVNGRRRDDFAATYLANEDGYWDGYIAFRNPVGIFTVETTYHIDLDLCAAELRPGKTIVVQPAVAFDHADYQDVDYGRFIIKEISFSEPCGGVGAFTEITVINSLHAFGTGFGFSSGPSLPVRIYFSEDSVSFNNQNVIDNAPPQDYRRLHEIYINENGKTFSHERARMPNQAEDASPAFLGTSKWHIRSVSPKLRGYRDPSGTTFNKYVRFYVESYDSVTGEFEGHLGQRPDPLSTSLLNPGILVRGRKNVPIRFYDETNVDYIELEYKEEGSITTVLSTALPRFVDIEVFPSFEEQDEQLLLATCEVNWDPDTNKDVVQHVTDRRSFGSVNADDFTNSAKDWITAADRHLHENGIIRGFDYNSKNPSDERELYFDGGVALVNGKVVSANNSAVNIPRLYDSTDPPAPTVDIKWTICVNEYGILVPILTTDTKTQILATAGSGNYYVQSVTFPELVNTRKDLTPIYIVTVTIGSFVIGEPKDIRRLIVDSGRNLPMTLSASGLVASFNDIEVVKNWINSYGGVNNVIKLRGDFAIDTAWNLGEFNYPVVLEGEGGTITVTASQGFVLGSNITLRNLKFAYDPSGITYTSGDYVNYDKGGCLYATGDVDNVKVDDCEFSCSFVAPNTQRPPFITFALNNEKVANRITITNCKFNDETATKDQAAIAFVGTNVGATEASVVSDVLIAHNSCNSEQGIYITCSYATSINGPGINAINSEISSNSCGAIGFFISSVKNWTSIDGLRRPSTLKIINNTSNFIGNLKQTGVMVGGDTDTMTTIPWSTGNIIVSSNSCNWVKIYGEEVLSDNTTASISITDNNLKAHDSAYLLSRFDESLNAAIKVDRGINSSRIISNVIVCGNRTDFGIIDNAYSYGYKIGLDIWLPGTYTNNIIKGLEDGDTTTIGIRHNAIGYAIISNNKIYRATNFSILAFIYFTETAASGIAVDNVFSSPYVDYPNSDTSTLGWGIPELFIAERNINQTVVRSISDFYSGNFRIGTFIRSSNEHPNRIFSVNTYGFIRFEYQQPGTEVSFVWGIELGNIIPENTTIVNAGLKWYADIVPDVRGSLTISLTSYTTTYQTDIDDYTIAASGAYIPRELGTGATATTLTTVLHKNYATNPSKLEVMAVIETAGSPGDEPNIYISDMYVTYRW